MRLQVGEGGRCFAAEVAPSLAVQGAEKGAQFRASVRQRADFRSVNLEEATTELGIIKSATHATGKLSAFPPDQQVGVIRPA